MDRINIAYLLRAVQNGHSLRGVIDRAVGKTTAAVLRAIAESYDTPGSWIDVKDPDIDTRAMAEDLRRHIMRTCSKLGLGEIQVEIFAGSKAASAYGVRVRNTFAYTIS